jgi:hypothetical protein
MAVTITRTPWIDDDGTGTTGTVINNAVKTALYNDIDGALAKVPQLNGANTFTGAQTITGNVGITGTQTITGNQTMLGTARLCINNATDPVNSQLFLSVDSTARSYGLAVYSSNAANNLVYVQFLSSGLAATGAITQTGAGSVTYGTTSDIRLKTDYGPATDLTALRGVVIHDFAWTADDRHDRGVFAQDAAAVFPRAIVAGSDETTGGGSLAHPWMTDYSKFVPDLIVGWQQHDAAIAEIRAALAAGVGV